MKSVRMVGCAAILAGVIALASSCNLVDTGPKRIRYIVAVDNIVVPDTVQATDTLFVGLRGIIAYDGCAQFDGLVKNRSGGTIDYTVYALYDDRRICVQTLILLNRVDTVLPPQVNPTTIRAMQPNQRSPLTRTIVVREG